MNGIPSSETVWVTTVSGSGATYYVTSKTTRDKYYLYVKENDKAVRIASSKNPLDFEEKMV